MRCPLCHQLRAEIRILGNHDGSLRVGALQNGVIMGVRKPDVAHVHRIMSGETKGRCHLPRNGLVDQEAHFTYPCASTE